LSSVSNLLFKPLKSIDVYVYICIKSKLGLYSHVLWTNIFFRYIFQRNGESIYVYRYLLCSILFQIQKFVKKYMKGKSEERERESVEKLSRLRTYIQLGFVLVVILIKWREKRKDTFHSHSKWWHLSPVLFPINSIGTLNLSSVLPSFLPILSI
jgi:hypothetical protein